MAPKPRPMGLAINCSQEALDARESYTVDAGVFAKDNVAIGADGIKSIAPGRYKLEDFELGEILGKATHCPACGSTLSALCAGQPLQCCLHCRGPAVCAARRCI